MSAEGRMGGGQRRQRRRVFCGAGGGSERSRGWLITAALLIVAIGGAAAEQFHPNKSTTFINKEQLFKVPLPPDAPPHTHTLLNSLSTCSLSEEIPALYPYSFTPTLFIPARH